MDFIYQHNLPLPDSSACHSRQHELYSQLWLILMVDAVVVIAGVGLFAFIWWWAGARNYCNTLFMLANE
jgi:hypothetical protein